MSKRKIIFIGACLLLTGELVFGQTPPPPVGVPIDKEIPYLFVAGIALGIYVLLKRKKKLLRK